jgi:hypothetical protein
LGEAGDAEVDRLLAEDLTLQLLLTHSLDPSHQPFNLGSDILVLGHSTEQNAVKSHSHFCANRTCTKFCTNSRRPKGGSGAKESEAFLW